MFLLSVKIVCIAVWVKFFGVVVVVVDVVLLVVFVDVVSVLCLLRWPSACLFVLSSTLLDRGPPSKGLTKVFWPSTVLAALRRSSK
jgi:hypothetical protein